MFTQELFNQIFQSNAEQKLLIVPAQLTLSAEQAAFKYSKKDVFFDFHIMSGNKLRTEIITKTGGPGRTLINTAGRELILRRVCKELSASGMLKQFSASVSSPQFLTMAGDFILQSKQNEAAMPPDTSAFPEILQNKLSDLALIKECYEKALEGKYLDSEDNLYYATLKIADCDWIKKSEIWFAGFYSFTKREQNFLNALRKASKGLHIYYSAPEDSGVFVWPKQAENTFRGVIVSDSPREQLFDVAAEILRLVRDEGFSADDIVVLSPDLSSYGSEIRRTFESVGIPVYIDEKKNFKNLKAAKTVSFVLDMAADGLNPGTVSCFVDKPAFTNYIKKYHIKGNAFLAPFKYGGPDKIEPEAIREEFALLIKPFLDDFSAAKTIREKSEALYAFLSGPLALSEKLREESLRLAENGETDASEETRQAFGLIVSVLDQAVELAGADTASCSEYRDIIISSFDDITVGILPQRSGCVQVGDLYRTKPYSAGALFILSLNEGIIPRIPSSDCVLTDAEQEFLSKSGGTVFVKPASILAREDRFILYEAFSAPEKYLYLCCSRSDSEGSEIRPSRIISGRKEYEKCDRRYLGYGFAYLTVADALRKYKFNQKELGAEDETAAALLSSSPRFNAMIKGLLRENSPLKLNKECLDALLKPNRISPSAIESYAKCPYAFFIDKGLWPDSMDTFDIAGRNIGDIYHNVLKKLADYLSSDGLPVTSEKSLWMTAKDEEIEALTEKFLHQTCEEDTTGLLTKGAKEEYITGRVLKTAVRFTKRMVSHVRCGNIDEIKAEQKFSFDFKGTTIYGTIDRVDTTHLSGGDLVKVIDYKSGSEKFDIQKIEQGLAVQLFTYLEAVTSILSEPDYAASKAREIKPIGTFYFKISDPKTEAALEDLGKDGLAEKLSQNIKLDGAYVDEPDRITAVDKYAVPAGGKSNILKTTQKMSEADYSLLRESFRNSLSQTLSELKSGNISVAPKRLSAETTSCTYCKYKSVCAFDPSLNGFHF